MAHGNGTTARYFGPKYYAENYGLVFLGNGIGCFLGNLISGQSKDLFGNYSIAFLIALVLSVLAIVISLGLLKAARANVPVRGIANIPANE